MVKWDTSIYYSNCSAHNFYFRKTNNSHICTDSGTEPADSRHFPGSLLFFNSVLRVTLFLWVHLLSPLGKIYCFLHAVPNHRSLLIQDRCSLLAFLAVRSICAIGQ